MRVLVADDNIAVLALAAEILSGAGVDVVAADDGKSALAALRASRFDLVLLDSRMPSPDGTGLLHAELPIAGGQAVVPTVGLVPAGDAVAETGRCLAAGMADVLVKPLRRDQLLAALERFRPMSAKASPPIDFDHLRRYTEGDAALEQELLDLFVQGAAGYLATLAAATDDKAWTVSAHSLKGSARGIGAGAIAALAEEAERLAGTAAGDRPAQLAAVQGAMRDVEAFVAARKAAGKA